MDSQPELPLEVSSILWSEDATTTRSDVLLDEIARSKAQASTSASRVLRVPIARRRPPVTGQVGPTQPIATFSFSNKPSCPPVDRQSSDASFTSTFTLMTATTASTDPWVTSGFVEDEEIGMEIARHDSEELDILLQPKIESPENDAFMEDMPDTVPVPQTIITETITSPSQLKRPRGRPRKHPVQPPESMNKVAKGRSKTGCITCRKRKKKCDEAKPRCMNCEKNAVLCEGYPERTIWKSGKEKAEEAQIRKMSIPNIKLEPVIHGVETPGDRIFFEHYVFRLSAVLTVEGPTKNAFKDMLLPLAVKHLGLMHSILALSSSNIDYRTSYGAELLAKHPDVTENMLQERAQFHQDEALKEFHLDIQRQQEGIVEDAILSVRYGQMLCMVVQSIAEGNPTGEHRIHLQGYQKLIRESPPEEGPFMEFIKEYFQYHITADAIIGLPQEPERVENVSEEWELPDNIIQPAAVHLLGMQDRLFLCMSRITRIRNKIRINMENHIEPIVDYSSLYQAAEIDADIREWKPTWPNGDARDVPGILYKQMMWVYLWRTIYPPRTNNWLPEPKITQAVADGLKLLELVPANDPNQTILLAPSFIIGCAAFELEQRAAIRKVIETIKNYTNLKNADRALEVLEEVWRFMDAKDERSWDWQTIAHNMHMDFLAT